MKSKHYLKSLLFWCSVLLVPFFMDGQSLTETYSDGDIPTNWPSYNSTCNGQGTTLTFELPTGGPWEVTGIDIEYDMTAAGSGTMAEQRSYIYFQNEDIAEDEQAGSGNSNGTFNYNRTGVAIANGYYPSEEELIFQMRAWRTSSFSFPQCATNLNKVDDNSWTITVHYQAAPTCIPPQELAASSTSPTQGNVSWTEIGTAAEWNIEYGQSGFTQGSGTPVLGINTETYEIINLSPETDYDVYVQSACGGEESLWVGPVSFTTPLTMVVDVSGFNEDVIANGVGSMNSSTTNIVDSDSFCFLSKDWKLTAGSPDVSVGLPADGVISNGSIVYKMSPLDTPYEGNNSLRIETNTSRTLTLNTPNNFEELYFLATSGSGSSNVTIEVNFDDATSQTFTGVTIPDWYQTGLPIEASGFGRGNVTNNNVETPSGNPKMFRITASISPANQAKTINSITFTRNSGGVVNIFAVSGIDIGACIPPTDLALDDVSETTADVSWEMSFTETEGYNWVVMAQGDIPDVDAPLETGTVDTGETSTTVTGLDPQTLYDFYIKADCGVDGESTWVGPLSIETLATCPEPTDLQIDSVDESSVEISWTGPANETNGYIWAVMASGEEPGVDTPVDNGVTATGTEMVEITGLTPDTTYDFYVKADCGVSDGESLWSDPITFTTAILAIPIEVVGLNADVIANGVGTMASSTNNDVDGVNFIFISEDWKLTAGSPDAPVGLPENGIVNSSLEGVSYQMSPFDNPYEGNNSLRIENTGTSGELELQTPAPYEALYFLVTSGSGSSNVNITVNFIDNTTQNFTGIGISDWFNGNPYEAAGFGRGSLNDNNLETPFNNPRLYRVTVNIDEANQTKIISSITVTKNSGGVVNIFAVTGKSGNPCIAPSGVVFDVLSESEIDISWTPSPLEANGYEWALMVEGEHPASDTPVDSGTTASGVTNISVDGLDPDTSYDFYIQTLCADGSSFWGGPYNTQTLPTCAPPSDLTIVDVDDNTIEASWTASPHVTSGYNWAVMLPGEHPDVDTPIQEDTEPTTSVQVSGLDVNTDMVFFVETDCDPNGTSIWVEAPFIIESVGSICENPIEINSLPYSHTDDTSEYLNIYSGAPGTDCGATQNYLNGHDVIYHLTAPEDDLITIELADITGTYAGIFIYESCDDIGDTCIGGAVNANGEDDIVIQDYMVSGGSSYYIVVSSWQSVSIEYTLNIYSFDCLAFEAPEGEEEQDFVTGDVVNDLEVESTMDDTSFRWYEDENLTIEILDPSTELLVDGETYYVTQTLTINDCESSALAITVNEIDCTVLSVTTTGDMLCTPGGEMTLFAEGSGNGDGIYWYDAQTGGNLIGIGDELTVNVAVTTSFWASEVYLEDGIGDSGPLPDYCSSFGFGTGCSGGDNINDFILEDDGGTPLISHLGSGCSPGAYGDFTNDPNLTATLIAGQTYNFEATHNFGGQHIKIWIDFNKDGVFDDASELLFTSPGGANPTNGSFTIPTSASGNTTAMRVFDRWNSSPASACTSGGSWGEVHDYKVTVVGSSLLCESDSVEAVAFVNTEFPDPPVVDEELFSCVGMTLDDLDVVGDNIRWYSVALVELPGDTEVQDGTTYYVTQTVDLCESDYAEVTITIMDPSEIPTGNENQTYVDGDTIADLEVDGEDLTWYADEDATVEIPTTTLLVDQETYYVTQTSSGFCESDTFGITVYEVLTIEELFFGGLEYYPNPVENQLNIVNTMPIDQIEVYNVIGQKVMVEMINSETALLDLEDLKSGVYFINIKIEDRTRTYKIIKE